MLAEKKLVRHSRDVVTNDDVARRLRSHFFVGIGHRIRLANIETEKFLEAAHGPVAILGNERMSVDMSE